MTRYLLAPLGRAEPDDVQGWMEQGGLLAVQLALSLPPATLRSRFSGIRRRDGRGALQIEEGMRAALQVAWLPPPAPATLVLEEMPAWLVTGGLLLARAAGQLELKIHLSGAGHAPRALLDEVLQRMEAVGCIGPGGWTGGLRVEVGAAYPPAGALDVVTALVLPLLLRERRDPGTTLLAATGAVRAPGVYEVPVGIPAREFLYSWVGGPTGPATIYLDDHPLHGSEMGRPLIGGRLRALPDRP